jgi:hypothetical protein
VELVGEAGELTDDQLLAAFPERGIAVAHNRERLIRSFAWYLKAKGFLERSEPDERWSVTGAGKSLLDICPCSIDGMAEAAKQLFGQGLAEEEVFEHLVQAVAGGDVRLPKPYVRAIGAGIWKAGRQ